MPRPPRPDFSFDDLPQIDVASAAVLLHPNRRDAQSAVRCALAGLALSGVLRHEQTAQSTAFGIREVSAGIILPPPLRSIHTLLHNQLDGLERLWSRPQLRLLLQSEFGVGYRRFIRQQVYPWLGEKGLVDEREKQVLSIIPATRFELTPTGASLQGVLRAAQAAADKVGDLTNTDRRAAAVRMIELGPALFLTARPSETYRRFAEIMATETAGLDVERSRAESAPQRRFWVDAHNPPKLPRTEFTKRFDLALAAADFIDNSGP